MKITLQGTAAEIEAAAAKIKESFRIVSYSRAFKDRGEKDSFQVYIEVCLEIRPLN